MAMNSGARWTWVAGAFFALVAGPLCAVAWGQNRDADRAAIQVVLSAQQEAWNRGDVDTFLIGYWHSPDLTFSGSSGISRGWKDVLERYKKNYPDRAAMGRLDFSELEFRFLGKDNALVLGHWHLARGGHGPNSDAASSPDDEAGKNADIGGVFTLVFQRFEEGWRIIHDHTSAVAAN